MRSTRRGRAARPRRSLPVGAWIAALVLGPIVGAFVGSLVGMFIGGSVGSPEGEGVIGLWYGGLGGAAIGFLLALAVLVFVQTRRARPQRASRRGTTPGRRHGADAALRDDTQHEPPVRP